MSIDLPLEKMTLADKLQAMELLGADISRQPSDLPLPAWHRDVLDERRRLVARGKLKFLDWYTAIAELREGCRLERNPVHHHLSVLVRIIEIAQAEPTDSDAPPVCAQQPVNLKRVATLALLHDAASVGKVSKTQLKELKKGGCRQLDLTYSGPI